MPGVTNHVFFFFTGGCRLQTTNPGHKLPGSGQIRSNTPRQLVHLNHLQWCEMLTWTWFLKVPLYRGFQGLLLTALHILQVSRKSYLFKCTVSWDFAHLFLVKKTESVLFIQAFKVFNLKKIINVRILGVHLSSNKQVYNLLWDP